MDAGFRRLKLPLVAAKALDASRIANPIIKVLVTVVNFMLLLFSSRSTSGTVRAARLTKTRENTCVSARIASQCCRWGEHADESLQRFHGGFLTWAAKPECEKIPKPR